MCHVRAAAPPAAGAGPRAEKGRRGDAPRSSPQQQRRIIRTPPTAQMAQPKTAHTAMSAVRRPRSLTFGDGAFIEAGAVASDG